jgi:hypothetical protein
MCIGDFNEVLQREERDGVNERRNTKIASISRDLDIVCVCQCVCLRGLVDLGYIGIKWTFKKKFAGGSYC